MFGKQNNPPPRIPVQFSDRRVWNNEILGGVEPLVTHIGRRPLPNLGNRTQTTFDRGLEDIDFGSRSTQKRAIVVRRPTMFLVRVGATRQPLARKIRKVSQAGFVAGYSEMSGTPFEA